MGANESVAGAKAARITGSSELSAGEETSCDEEPRSWHLVGLRWRYGFPQPRPGGNEYSLQIIPITPQATEIVTLEGSGFFGPFVVRGLF